jgi:glycosyltransferase involved in cell wall biosynthesis
MAAGCAIVATDIEGPVRELVNEQCGLLVPVGEIDLFVDAIAAIATRAREYGAAAHSHVSDTFPLEPMLMRYGALIHSVARRQRSEPAWRAPTPILTSPSELTLPPLFDRLRRKLRL